MALFRFRARVRYARGYSQDSSQVRSRVDAYCDRILPTASHVGHRFSVLSR